MSGSYFGIAAQQHGTLPACFLQQTGGDTDFIWLLHMRLICLPILK